MLCAVYSSPAFADEASRVSRHDFGSTSFGTDVSLKTTTNDDDDDDMAKEAPFPDHHQGAGWRDRMRSRFLSFFFVATFLHFSGSQWEQRRWFYEDEGTLTSSRRPLLLSTAATATGGSTKGSDEQSNCEKRHFSATHPKSVAEPLFTILKSPYRKKNFHMCTFGDLTNSQAPSTGGYSPKKLRLWHSLSYRP